MPSASVTITCDQSPSRVKSALSDLSFIASAVPDLKSVEKLTETKAIWNAQVKFGFIEKTIALESEVTKSTESEIGFRAEGSETAINGSVLIKPIDGGKSELILALAIEGKGPLKAVIDNYMRKKLRDDIQKVGRNFEEKLNALTL